MSPALILLPEGFRHAGERILVPGSHTMVWLFNLNTVTLNPLEKDVLSPVLSRHVPKAHRPCLLLLLQPQFGLWHHSDDEIA